MYLTTFSGLHFLYSPTPQKYQKFMWKGKNFSVTLNFKVFHWYKTSIFYLTRFKVQPQARKILRPMFQQPPLPEVKHNAMLLRIAEKTSPIVDSRPKVLISSDFNLCCDWKNGTTNCFSMVSLRRMGGTNIVLWVDKLNM